VYPLQVIRVGWARIGSELQRKEYDFTDAPGATRSMVVALAKKFVDRKLVESRSRGAYEQTTRADIEGLAAASASSSSSAPRAPAPPRAPVPLSDSRTPAPSGVPERPARLAAVKAAPKVEAWAAADNIDDIDSDMESDDDEYEGAWDDDESDDDES
jgi:hypothetical protein